MQNWEFEHSLEIRVSVEIEKKWQSKDLSVRISHRLWTRKVIFFPVLFFFFSPLVWRRTETNSCEGCGFHFGFLSCWPNSENKPGRERWWYGRAKAWMGTMRFFVLSPLNLFSPDMERTSFQFVNGNSSAVLLKFSVSLALLTSINFKYHAESEPFLTLLLRLTISLWITL